MAGRSGSCKGSNSSGVAAKIRSCATIGGSVERSRNVNVSAVSRTTSGVANEFPQSRSESYFPNIPGKPQPAAEYV